MTPKLRKITGQLDQARVDYIAGVPRAYERAQYWGEMYALEVYKEAQIEPPSITCPWCGLKSFNPHDIKHKYCGNCHMFHDEFQDRKPKSNANVETRPKTP